MTASINGIHYDTDDMECIANNPSPDGDDRLYQAESGEFFLEMRTTFLDGRKLQPLENAFELAPELLRGAGQQAERHRRLRIKKRLLQMTSREAMVWCIKTNLPECFRGYLLESI